MDEIRTHEVVHSLNKSKLPGMLVKIDLPKAYDHLSWEYIISILDAFGFLQA